MNIYRMEVTGPDTLADDLVEQLWFYSPSDIADVAIDLINDGTSGMTVSRIVNCAVDAIVEQVSFKAG